jgi:1-acyl-sn-glycerol-3-phosphate acyltransferase
MPASLPLPLRLSLIVALLVLSTIAHVTVLMLATAGKAVAPARSRGTWSERSVRIAERWIAFNSALIDRYTRTRWRIDLPPELRLDRSYLVLSNHQSWVDIPVLQYVFNRRIPFLRFFLKSELIWVPFLGPAWWALDFPFMKRYSREQLERRPELAGTDVDATRRACEKFREIPVAVMNFVEGTRFTPEKHAARASPFHNLLRPKAGGVAFVLDAMGGSLQAILDVTVVYPNGRPTLLDLLADRVREVRVHVQELPIPADAVGGDYEGDPVFRETFQTWMNGLWQAKDARVAALRDQPGEPHGG